MRCEEQSLILVSSIKDRNNKKARLVRHTLEYNEAGLWSIDTAVSEAKPT